MFVLPSRLLPNVLKHTNEHSAVSFWFVSEKVYKLNKWSMSSKVFFFLVFWVDLEELSFCCLIAAH